VILLIKKIVFVKAFFERNKENNLIFPQNGSGCVEDKINAE
jgi:hypothetical protein